MESSKLFNSMVAYAPHEVEASRCKSDTHDWKDYVKLLGRRIWPIGIIQDFLQPIKPDQHGHVATPNIHLGYKLYSDEEKVEYPELYAVQF